MVWKEFIERGPSVKNYRDKTIPYYRDLDILVEKDYATDAEAGTGNDETNIPQEGFEVDNKRVESVYSTIDERTPNRVSSSTTPGASAPTSASAPKNNRVRRDSLDREGAIKKLALAADKLAGNVGRHDFAVLEKKVKRNPNFVEIRSNEGPILLSRQ
ncbi:hypothetical protein GIB67_041623 [Kingdonia uniflora]|uniref:Uncharacterized protein n=1 Tax=Kingdonia uniflora TaxID=39325 RepID=A0A7J7MQW1_9MAGN|nr:hypothetical protein GIB67_041623 [Kingdonia uniflora]